MKMLRHKEKLFVASGIYAAKEILAHHQKTKRSYNVNIYFEKLLEELYVHIGDDNEMVSRQLIATSKEVEDKTLKVLIDKAYST